MRSHARYEWWWQNGNEGEWVVRTFRETFRCFRFAFHFDFFLSHFSSHFLPCTSDFYSLLRNCDVLIFRNLQFRQFNHGTEKREVHIAVMSTVVMNILCFVCYINVRLSYNRKSDYYASVSCSSFLSCYLRTSQPKLRCVTMYSCWWWGKSNGIKRNANRNKRKKRKVIRNIFTATVIIL